jgi:hypothetical protein
MNGLLKPTSLWFRRQVDTYQGLDCLVGQASHKFWDFDFLSLTSQLI